MILFWRLILIFVKLISKRFEYLVITFIFVQSITLIIGKRKFKI